MLIIVLSWDSRTVQGYATPLEGMWRRGGARGNAEWGWGVAGGARAGTSRMNLSLESTHGLPFAAALAAASPAEMFGKLPSRFPYAIGMEVTG